MESLYVAIFREIQIAFFYIKTYFNLRKRNKMKFIMKLYYVFLL